MKSYEEMRREDRGGGRFVDPTTGLAPDYANAWMWLTVREGKETGPPSADEGYWRPVLHYEDYMRGQNHPYVEQTLLDSDPAKVTAVNAIVDEFNAQLDELKTARNYDEGYKFFQRVDALIRGTSPE